MFNRKLKQPLAEAEQQLAQQQAVFQALEGHVALIQFQPDGTIIDANGIFLDTVGYTAAAVLGQHHRMFCEPNYARSAEYRQFWQDLANGKPQRNTFKRLKKDGSPLWLEATYLPVKDSSGRTVRVIKIAADVTQQTTRLNEQLAVYKALDKAMAIIEFTPQGNILAANQNFLQAVGYRLAELQGQHHRLFCNSAFFQQQPNFWQQLAAGEFKSGKFQRFTKSGREIWLEASYNPVLNERGEVVKVVKFATDITARVCKAIQTTMLPRPPKKPLCTLPRSASRGGSKLVSRRAWPKTFPPPWWRPVTSFNSSMPSHKKLPIW
jgi:methyl-accepting chemotaxis protein